MTNEADRDSCQRILNVTDCGGNEIYAKKLISWMFGLIPVVTHASVVDEKQWFANGRRILYLEGADQYRGWFQSSLLTAVATGKVPHLIKTVCTHGWVVDGEGRKMSKSLGKTDVAPEEIIEQYGADILRLWVASSDYHADIRISQGYPKAALRRLP